MTTSTTKVTIFFDYESTWGMPTKHPYDLVSTTAAILGVLKKHGTAAVFNTTGKIVETNPELIKAVHAAGHEIAIHGYNHTNPAHMTATDNEQFNTDLTNTEQHIEKLIGIRPIGFRSPHLGAPRFHDEATYHIFASHNYNWASNRELRFIDEATSPRLLGRGDLIGLAGNIIYRLGLDRLPATRLICFALLNARVLIHDQVTPIFNLISNTRWLFGKRQPFHRGPLREIPVLSPLDCDFLGDQIDPAVATPTDQIDHMVTSLCREFDEAEEYFNLNFHDWIIGTSNRLEILDRVLVHINQSNRATWVLAKDLA